MNAEKTDETLNETNQYLTFTLRDEDFALDIRKVREVRDYITITRVPRMPEYLRGIINLRGNVVPIVDLRFKLGIASTEQSMDTCIVIVEIMIDDEVNHIGALADSVKEVIDLDPTQISPPPKLGIGIRNEFIKGVVRQDDNFLIILDIDRIITAAKPDIDKIFISEETTDLSGQDKVDIFNMSVHTPNAEQKSMEQVI